MRASGAKIILLLLCIGAVDGCSRNNEPKLLNITSSTNGPDEFAIIPTKPLEAPEDFTALPKPTLGGSNLVDPTPHEDAVAALGGNPNALSRGVSSRDAGLINHSSRYGRDGAVRQKLAAEDLEFRRRNNGRVLERLFNVNVYFKAYARMALDQYAELERFRRAGVRTPAAPPEPVEE